jgi:hypothetical protein
MHADFADDCMGQGLNSLSPLSDEQQQDLIDEEYLTTIRAAQQAEWAHLLAVEGLWLHESSQSTITEWARYYARKKHWQASLAAYKAEFNPKAE